MSNDFKKQELSTKVCIYFGFSLIYGLHCYSSAWIQGYSALWFLRYLFLCFILRGAILITAGGQLLKPRIHLHIFLFSVYVFLSTHTHTHTNASVVLTGASFHCEVSRQVAEANTLWDGNHTLLTCHNFVPSIFGGTVMKLSILQVWNVRPWF